MTASLDEMKKVAQDRFTHLENVLETTSEETLNAQPFENKRTIAEIMVHMFRGDSAPLWFKRVFYTILNVFTGLVNEGNQHPVDASDYMWRYSEGKKRSPSFISKLKLSAYYHEAFQASQKSLANAAEKHRSILHYTEYHNNRYWQQVKVLLDTLS